MTNKIEVLFHDYEGHRDLVAVGLYTPHSKGGWLDGKRSEPETFESMEIYDILTPEGGSVDSEHLRHSALEALWDSVTVYDVEDW